MSKDSQCRLFFLWNKVLEIPVSVDKVVLKLYWNKFSVSELNMFEINMKIYVFNGFFFIKKIWYFENPEFSIMCWTAKIWPSAILECKLWWYIILKARFKYSEERNWGTRYMIYYTRLYLLIYPSVQVTGSNFYRIASLWTL